MGAKLEYDWIINTDKATPVLESFKNKIIETEKTLNDVGEKSQFGSKVSTQLEKIISKSGDVSKALQQIRVDNVVKSFDDLEKKALDTQKGLAEISKVRLDNGQIGSFTKEIINAQQRSKQLTQDIANIRKELANPNKKSSTAFLTEELKGAEKQLEVLDRKLKTLPASTAAGAKSKRSTEFNRALLEITDDFAPAGFNRPFNAVGKELLPAISTASLATFGAVAAAGYGIVKLSEHVRDEAERRLKAEEQIASAMNRQVLASKEVVENFEKQRKFAAQDRDFGRYLQNNDVDQLKSRRTTLEQLNKLIPATLPILENGKVVQKTNENYEKNSQQILALDAQIDALNQQRKANQDKAFNDRFEYFRKSQDDAVEVERKQIEKAEKFKQSINQGKEKVLELQKAAVSALDDLFARSGSSNPFVLVYSEGEKALNSLREKTKLLSPELKKTFEGILNTQTELATFETRLNTKLSAFDLRSEAQSFRNPGRSQADEEMFNSIVNRNINGLGSNSTGEIYRKSYGSDLFARTKGNLSDSQKRAIYESVLLGAPDANPAGSTFNKLNQESLISSLARERNNPFNNNKNALEKLNEQLNIIENLRKTNKSIEAGSIADKRIIALTSGLDPNQLTGRIREEAAASREREALRQEQAEKEANQKRDQQLEYSKKIAEEMQKLREIAEKEGGKGIDKLLVEVVDKAGIANTRQVKAPTPSDTLNSMQ